MSCCPLHNHSEYSNIDGLSLIREMAERMEQIGSPYCGLTDHGVVAGHLEFDKVFRKKGLKPIFGCELYHGIKIGEKLGQKRDQAHLIALAMTDEGLRNLWRLNDAAAQEERFHHVGRNMWEDFEKYKDGIVFTSGCDLSLTSKGIMRGDYSYANRYLEIFRDNFYVELSTYPAGSLFYDKDSDEPISPQTINEAKIEWAQERGVPVVYGDDGHYAFPEQFKIHDAYVAKATGQTIFTQIEDRKMYHPPEALCIKDEATVRESLSYLPDSVVDEAIANSVAIGERADAHLPEVKRHLPVFIPKDCPWIEKEYADDEADLLFIDLVEKGMKECYGEEPAPRVVEQTMYEADVFLSPPGDDPDAVPLFHYFLWEWDMIQFCKDPHAIFDTSEDRAIEVGPGRGSSAGCIIARELGITDIDPLPYDLYFERFWNPGRAKGFPDIDTDIERGRRREVKDYLSWRIGHDKVRSIGTNGRMQPKSVVETFSRTLGIQEAEEKALKKIVDDMPDIDILGPDQIGWDEDVDPGKVLYVMHPTKDYPDNDTGEKIIAWVGTLTEERQKIVVDALEILGVLCNRAKGQGVHASGIVISDVPLDAELPCRFAGSPEQRIPVTQFAMKDVDDRQFIKLDALGLRTLDVLADWKKSMKDFHDIDIDWSQLEWSEEAQYPEIWDNLEEGYAAGVFQIEKGYPKQLAERTGPRSIEGLSLILAGNRPGPIRSGAVDSILTRMEGGEDDEFDGRKIPVLANILDTSYGWFLYQEQVIAYFNALGYELSDSDAVRKILGKKQPEKWDALYNGTEEWAGKSYVEMTKRAGLSRETADLIWAKLKDFARYSFNKAHTVAYGTISFRCAFAKAYEPALFYKACIKNVDNQKKALHIPAFINEARRKQIGVHGVDIERSSALVEVSPKDGDIYFGFNDVKKVSEEGAHYLVEMRDEMDATVETPEALSEFLATQSKEWNARKKALIKEGKFLDGKSPGQKFNNGHIGHLYTAGAWERLEGFPTPLRDMQARELEMLNVILTDNSEEMFALHSEDIDQLEDTYAEAKGTYPGYDVQYTLPGVITMVEEKIVKQGPNKGKKMGIVTIEYNGDELEFAVFTNKWSSYRFMWNVRTPGIFTIKHSEYDGRVGYNFQKGTVLK